jgi:hypothetical protein
MNPLIPSYVVRKNRWAVLKNTRFEGALLSSSDVVRTCENPTLEMDTRRCVH